MKFGKLFDDFRKLNPWPVVNTEQVESVLDGLMKDEEQNAEGGKTQRLIIELFQKATHLLRNFPPDDTFFTDPRPYLFDVTVWLVVSQAHKKIMLKAEYRLYEHLCVVTEFSVK